MDTLNLTKDTVSKFNREKPYIVAGSIPNSTLANSNATKTASSTGVSGTSS